jgi:hypothetical protein
MIKDSLHVPPVSTIAVVHLELRISPWIFEKLRKGPKNGIPRGLGETDSWHCPFKCSRWHKRARSNHGPLLPVFCSSLWELSFSNICRKKTVGQVLVLINLLPQNCKERCSMFSCNKEDKNFVETNSSASKLFEAYRQPSCEPQTALTCKVTCILRDPK